MQEESNMNECMNATYYFNIVVFNPNLSFIDSLKTYFDTYSDSADYAQKQIISFTLTNARLFLNVYEKRLLDLATQLQIKAGKCDVLFKMLDSFNQNSIHCTITWRLLHNTAGTFLKSLIIH